MDTFEELWQSVLDYCKQRINETAFTLWLLPIEIGDFNNGKVVLKFSNSFKKNTVVGQYGELLNEAFEAVCGFPVEIEYTSPEDFLTESEKNQQDLEDFKNETFTFDNFIVGPSNKFAYTAAKAIAADPGGQISKGNNLSNYNPLFIYGNSGLGKTHILNAISYEVRRNYPDMKVVYVTCEEFLNEFLANMYKKNNEEFRNKYRNIDVLLIDDIQFIAGKDRVQEEFFHTFNTLREDGKQIIISSDTPPRDIQFLEDRLKSRFEWGLLADISCPDYETRLAILRKKAQDEKIIIDDAILSNIATNIDSNIRELEGVFNKIVARAALTHSPITMEHAELIINEFKLKSEKVISSDFIKETVAKYFSINKNDLASEKRSNDIAFPRQIAMFLCRDVANMSFPQIGKDFGDRDHSTVMHAYNKIKKEVRDKNNTKLIVESVKNIITSEED